MTEQDDLFEFGSFDNDDALELDLDELFGDLELLAVDPNAPIPDAAKVVEAPAPVSNPVEAATAPAAAQQQPTTPQPAPIPTPQVAHAAPGTGPAGMPYVVNTQPPPNHLSKANIAIGVAAIVTLANVAVIAAPLFRSEPSPTAPTTIQVGQQTIAPEAGLDTDLLERIDQLEMQIRGINSPPETIRSGSDARHRAFDEIESNLASGEFLVARQRLYSLLSIVDRFPTHERDRIEELASYTLADTFLLEAKREGQILKEGQL